MGSFFAHPLRKGLYQAGMLLLSVSLIFCGGCTTKVNQENTTAGVWQSLGGGWVLDIEPDGNYREYDRTSVSCLPARTAHIEEFGKRLYIKDDTLKLRRGVIEYSFVRAQALPERCAAALSEAQREDPLMNFEVFAQTVREHYAFMALNSIDWEPLYETHKAKLNATSNELQLYQVLEEMVEQLKDNHGYLEASDAVYAALEQEASADEEATEAEIGDFQVSGAVAEHHLETEFTRESGLIQWGVLTDSIGYIQIKAMFLFADLEMPQPLIDSLGWGGAFGATKAAMNEGAYIEKERLGVAAIMDRVMEDLADMRSIVVDIRFNGGGEDAVSLEILKRFNDQPCLVAKEFLVHEGSHSPVWDVTLDASEPAYTRPVYVLTSQQTGSAAEAFALASLAIPHIKRIGMPTMGALSTALEKTLPNGWKFAISNEIYQDLTGAIYENRGVPVDAKLEYPADRQVFFRQTIDQLNQDKENILALIRRLSE